MSINLFALAWNISFPGKPAKKLVLLSLADSTNSAHAYTWPSYDTIAKRCGISRRAVINSVNELEAEGIVIREARYKAKNLRTSNAFRLNGQVMRQLADANALAFSDEPDTPSVVNTVHHSSEITSLGSEHSSPGVVNTVHRGSEHSSPKPELEPEGRTRNQPGRGNGAVAPARPPAASAQFQDVPEEVKRQKRRARVDELLAPAETPAVFAQAPPVMSLLHRLTGYWPGESKRDELIKQLGEQPDEAALTRAVDLWNLAGHKPTNFLGICEWYKEIVRDPEWTPGKRFKNNGYKNLRNDPDARESHNRAVLDEVAKEIQSGEWSPW